MRSLKLDPIRHLAVPAALLAMVAFNILAVTLPLGGRDTSEVSAMYSNLFTPAGFTFSIWSVIYIGLTAFTVYQFLPSQANKPVVQRVAVLFIISCLLNLSWLLTWHYLWIGMSVILMVLLLLTLILIYTHVARRKSANTTAYRIMVALPFRIYLGWISVATIANISAYLTSVGWDGSPIGETGWALILIGATVVLGLLSLWTQRDYYYTLVLVWGLSGIAAGQTQETAVMIGGIVGALLLVAGIVYTFMRSRPQDAASAGGNIPVPAGR